MEKKKKWIIILTIIVLILVLLILYLLFGRSKSVIITFDTDGGTAISEVKAVNGEIVKLPNAPVKEGYVFIGWVNNDNKIVTKGSKFKENTTLKAMWRNSNSDIVSITFDTDGGNKIDNIVMEKGGKILLPIDPVKEGYKFYGWIDENGNLISKDMIVTENITLKAYWIKKGAKTSTIIVDTDGGNNIENIIVENEKVIVLPVDPTKEGFVFAGWVDENGNSITKDTVVKGNITIKALWKEPYTCPSDCTPVDDGSKCTKQLTANMINSLVCPNGYSEMSGFCVNYSSKYHAASTSTSPFWKCNDSNEYMYEEEDGYGGAFMWCVKKTDKVMTANCPSGYTKDGNVCKKTETLECTAN